MLDAKTIARLNEERQIQENESYARKLENYSGRLNDIKRAIDQMQKDHETLWNKESESYKKLMTEFYNEIIMASGRAEMKSKETRKNFKIVQGFDYLKIDDEVSIRPMGQYSKYRGKIVSWDNYKGTVTIKNEYGESTYVVGRLINFSREN
jgi:hypothetical protein